MNITTESFYLYYLLQFIDNQLQIYTTIDETFCRQAILEEKTELFEQFQKKSYQFIYTDRHCIVKPLKDYNEKLDYKSQWIKSLMKYHFKNFSNYQIDTTSNLWNRELYERIKPKTFYIKKIQFGIKIELFKKIITNPDYCQKNYTALDVYHICNSSIFTILENRFTILQNILYLILQKSFKLSDIHVVFLNSVSQYYKKSEYFIKFNNQVLSLKNESDMLNPMKRFLSNHYDTQSNDSFLKDLCRWNSNFTNLISMIQQTFRFNIKGNHSDIIMQIYYTLNHKSDYNLSIDNFRMFLPFISDGCIFECIYSSDEPNQLFSCISKAQNELKIQINLTKIYLNLAKLDNKKIIEKCMCVEKFFSFLFNVTSQNVTIIIDNIKFDVRKNGDNLEISQINDGVHLQTNYSLLFNSFVLINILDKIGTMLKSIVEMILLSFFNLNFKNDIEIFFISKRQNILEFRCSERSLNQNFNMNGYLQHKPFGIVDSAFDEYFIVNGISFKGNNFICIENLNQKYQNLDFLSGVFDDMFSFFSIESQSDQPLNMSDIVKNLNIKSQIKADTNMIVLSRKFEIFNFYPDKTNCFIFHFNIDDEKSIFEESSWSFVSSSTQFRNCPSCQIKLPNGLYSINKECHKQTTKIYFEKLIEKDDIISEDETCNLISRKSSDIYFNFEISQSNFHFIISNFIDCKSLDRDLSSIQKCDYLVCHQIKVKNCYIKFLNDNFHIFELIEFNNCVLDCQLELFSKKCSVVDLNMYIKNFQPLTPIILSNFAKIEPLCDQNEFISCQEADYHTLTIDNCKITIFDVIPRYFTSLTFTNCEIVLSNDMNTLNIDRMKDQSFENFHSFKNVDGIGIISITPNLEFTLINCKSHDIITIFGVFNSLKIVDCISSFVIFSNWKLIEIKNQKKNFEIYPMIHKAVSQGENSYMKIEKQDLILKLKI